MKINEIRPNIESSDELDEQFFSIQDQGMIFDILRNKMYSNPILAICREITCNARDAHRENKISDTPIHIYLPNNVEPFYKVKDFGPGISPDRMSNIFIKYTASTKRDDDIQTGGFGLGAKTPFSYSDTFTVITIFNGIKYNYVCFIDETKVGKLALLSEEKTDQCNGTEIVIPVKQTDFRLFSEYTEQSTRHWSIKPIIKGNTLKWQEICKVIDGDDWCVAVANNWHRGIKLIIDSIEYPLELEALKKYADIKLIDSIKGNLYLYFNIGELSLSASREQVYLDKITQEKIKLKLTKVSNDIKQKIDTKINSLPNLWLANIYYNKELLQSFNSLNFLGDLRWQGILLTSRYITVNCPIFRFNKGKFSRLNGNDPNKLTRSLAHSLSFEENSMLFVNDLPLKEPTIRHVKKAFDDNPALTSVQVVCPTPTVSLSELNKTFHINHMMPEVLSSITKTSARKYTSSTSRLIVFKLDISSGFFHQVSYASISNDNKKKILCLLTKDTSHPLGRQVLLNNKKTLSSSSLKALSNKFDSYSFYGIDESTSFDRVEEDFVDFKDVNEFIETNIISNNSINYLEIKYANSYTYHLDDKLLQHYDAFSKLIENHDSIFMRRLNLHNKMKNMCNSNLGLLMIYESIHGEISKNDLQKFIVDNPNLDLNKINNLYERKYPLLCQLNAYNYAQIITPIAQYVNLIDNT